MKLCTVDHMAVHNLPGKTPAVRMTEPVQSEESCGTRPTAVLQEVMLRCAYYTIKFQRMQRVSLCCKLS